jgi:hypothetical protein
VPADPIPAALAQLTHTDPCQLQHHEASHLPAYLAAVPDLRAARGRRHPLACILGLAAAVKERWQLALTRQGEPPPAPLKACPAHLRATA